MLGIRIISHLDDTVILAHSTEMAITHWNFVLDLFRKLGIIVNLDKSDLSPKCFTFLGLQSDSSMHSVACRFHDALSMPQF